MLTQTQINAESDTPAITDEQIAALLGLVRQYQPYQDSGAGLWPQLEEKLAAEKDTPTIITKVLKAVLTALDALPSIVVESSGQRNSPSFFETKANWDALAQDVLNAFFKARVVIGPYGYGLVQKPIQDALRRESVIIRQRKTGRRF